MSTHVWEKPGVPGLSFVRLAFPVVLMKGILPWSNSVLFGLEIPRRVVVSLESEGSRISPSCSDYVGRCQIYAIILVFTLPRLSLPCDVSHWTNTVSSSTCAALLCDYLEAEQGIAS